MSLRYILIIIISSLFFGNCVTKQEVRDVKLIEGNIYGDKGVVLTSEVAIDMIYKLIPDNSFVKQLNETYKGDSQIVEFKLSPGKDAIEGYTYLTTGAFINPNLNHTISYKIVKVEKLGDVLKYDLLTANVKDSSGRVLRYRMENGKPLLSDDRGVPVRVSLDDIYRLAYYSGFSDDSYNNHHMYSALSAIMGIYSSELIVTDEMILNEAIKSSGVLNVNNLIDQANIDLIISNISALKDSIKDPLIKDMLFRLNAVNSIYTDAISAILLNGFKAKLTYDDKQKIIKMNVMMGNFIEASNLEAAIYGESQESQKFGRLAIEKFIDNFAYGRKLYSGTVSDIRKFKKIYDNF